MTYETIDFKVEAGIARITLNRPDKLNSFNVAMHHELRHALDSLGDARVVILTGAGRGFCAGQDLNDRAVASEHPVDLGVTVETCWNPLIRKLAGLHQPIIARVNGVAAGAGANVALACDLVVAARSAKFIQSFSAIGLIPDSGGTFTLPRLTGMQRAFGQMILAPKVTAKEAETQGLIWKAVPDADVIAEATALAQKLAAMPTKAIALTKEALNRSMTNSMDEQLDVENKLQSIAGRSYDYNEGVKAFLEKRKPVYKGE